MPNDIPLDEKRQAAAVHPPELSNVCDEAQQVALLSQLRNKTNEQHSFS
jgi:hypothetical protein